MTYRLGILGYPLGHTLSPIFHTAALKLCGLEGTYATVEVPEDRLASVWTERLKATFHGMNVTVPHKVSALRFMDRVSDTAARAGAVNTIVHERDGWVGHNTDVSGFQKALLPRRHEIEGKKAAVIGAGGAARAAIAGLSSEFGISSLIVVNRNGEHARALAREWETQGVGITPVGQDDPNVQTILLDCGVIVQATSVGMHPEIARSPLENIRPFREGQIVMDMIYRPLQTRFLREALAAGADVLGGLDMFLHQAAAAFRLWTGIEPPLEKIRPVIEKELRQ